MSILSLTFILFLAVLVPVYYLLPLRFRKWALLPACCVFWLAAGVGGTVYLVAESALLWAGARFIASRQAVGKSGRLPLAVILVTVLAAMMAVKEQGLLVSLLPHGASLPRLAVPLGLSYFTFQGAGYLLDVYRKKVTAEKNYLKVLLFCGFFPQLWQGPIGTWKDLAPRLDTPHRLDPQRFTAAFILIAWGYFKKLVIADRIAPFVTGAVASADSLPGWLALLAVIAYSLELYADFSGGIDIVRGAAGLLGIELAENFARPFFAVSVADYWRRWHISLGAWFRTYVLYPLAVSRAGMATEKIGKRLFGAKTGRALPGALSAFAVFVLIGLWHTLRWNALIYGCWFGILSASSLLMEPLFKKWKKQLGIGRNSRGMKLFGMVRTWLLVLFAQFFACTGSPGAALTLMERILTRFGADSFGRLSDMTFMTFDPAEWIVAAAALAILLVVDIIRECRSDMLMKLAGAKIWIRWPLIMALLLIVLVFGRYGVGYDAAGFVYAGF